jgi:hypothetical protein
MGDKALKFQMPYQVVFLFNNINFYFTYHDFIILKLHSAMRIYFCVSYGCHNKQLIFTNTINRLLFVAETKYFSCEVRI